MRLIALPDQEPTASGGGTPSEAPCAEPALPALWGRATPAVGGPRSAEERRGATIVTSGPSLLRRLRLLARERIAPLVTKGTARRRRGRLSELAGPAGAGTGVAAAPAVVLLVDDSPAIREVVVSSLAEGGYAAVAVPDGGAALAYLAGHRARLVLLDTYGVDDGGPAFMAAYRRRPGPHAPVYVFSVASDAEQRARRIGADGFLPKPYDLTALLELVRRTGGEPGSSLGRDGRGGRATRYDMGRPPERGPA